MFQGFVLPGEMQAYTFNKDQRPTRASKENIKAARGKDEREVKTG
jgi:hypothetical protein